MTKKALSRFSILLAVAILVAGAVWITLPTASAQKGGRSILERVRVGSTVSTDSNNDSLILLNAAEIDIRSPRVQAERASVGGFDGKRMHLVRFSGPIQPEWYEMLTSRGLEVIDYIPNYTYVVYGDSNTLGSLQEAAKEANSPIVWDGAFKDEYRIAPNVFVAREKNGQQSLSSERFHVQLYKDPEVNTETLKLIDSIRTSEVKGQQEILHYVNLVVGLNAEGIERLAARPDVISIQPYDEPRKLDERQDIILTGNMTANVPNPSDYLAYLTGKGFTQAQFTSSGFSVDITDSGVDNGTQSPNHFAYHLAGDPAQASRVIYNRLEGTPNSGSTLQGCDGHGNLNASIIMGNVPTGGIFAAFPHADGNGFRYGLGVAPFVKLGSSVIFDPDNFTSPNYANLQSRAYNDGARISSNSWGSSSNAYTTDAQSYDALVRDAQPTGSAFPAAGNQEMVIVFAAGNNGSGGNSVGSPSTAKNVITVGASENVQAFGGADACGTSDAEADSSADIVAFSSRGPTSDNRKKPDIMLPGTHVSGTVGQTSPVSPVSGNGAMLACFSAGGVCAGPGNSNFWPLGQQWYTASSGTSHSTPAIAGLSALIRQDFVNKSLSPPSPAMTKGIIMNSARYMTGTGANDSLPSNNQGMGLANLNNYFDVFAQSHILKDELTTETFTASGQQRIYSGTIVSSAKPVRVTLAWSDAPGATSGNAFVNNLDLEVTIGGNLYLGNVFSGANSATGGSADIRDNVESVFLPAGVSGPVVIKVKATNIAGDGVPGNGTPLDQDFALVASNLTETPVSVIQSNGVTLTAENGVPANNSPDPGETVTVSLTLQEVGTANSGTVSATLQNSGGITPVTTSQNYGTLPMGGAAVSKPFTFTVPSGAACGSTITLTFVVQDGTATQNVTKTYTLGAPNTLFAQTFDGVTAPALPADWTNVPIAGTGINWTTTSASSSSSPNSATAPDPATVNGAALVTPIVLVRSSAATLNFKNSYNTESSTDATTGYDGMVLDIKIGGGDFQDIIAAGGTFVSGGYNRTISSTFSNPLAGRMAWSGNSAGYVDTSVKLPASADGQSVQFRWVMASDSSVSATGVNIDSITMTGGFIPPNLCSTVSGGGTVKSRADFDADGKTDVSVFRPSTGDWYVARSGGGGILFQNWGIATDVVAPGDYDGDGKADLTIFRPADGNWWVIKSGTSTIETVQFGAAGDIPVAGDYDGDGKTDKAIFRPSTGEWYIAETTAGLRVFTYGAATDKPVPADYDNDGKTDLAVFRPSTGDWYIAGSTSGSRLVNWGTATDKPVPADYDGDGKDDVAIFRPSTGEWYVIRSSNGAVQVVNWGVSTDTPVPGDYDGDGKDDFAIFRPSTGNWFIVGSTSGVQNIQWGANGDTPVPSKYIP